MSESLIILWLSVIIVVLLGIVIYQQCKFRMGTQANLKKISRKLEEIINSGSDEQIMTFTDNKILMELMAQINQMLMECQRAKADFRRSEIASKKMLSNVSHDIKTPMTVILGYLEIIRLNGDPDHEMLKKVEAKAHRVMELINQFFTLAKLEAGDTDIELGRVNMNEACRENILDFYELLTQKAFQIEIEIPEENIYAQADPDAFQRIMFNLLSNAVRYGCDGKYLGLTLRYDEEFVYIDVADQGKGIEKAYASTVFERLYTLEDSRNRDMQGNGLGLTIAKNLARQMGGDLTLVSEPFVRTVFTVKLKRITF